MRFLLSKIRVYISGPMSGYKLKNKPMFDLAEAWLRKQGYDPVNPAAKSNEILDRNATEEEYLQFMRQDVYEILFNKGGVKEIWMLPGWSHSRGAYFEYRVATFFYIPIKFISEEAFRNDK